MVTALLAAVLVLTLMVGLLIGPPARQDGPPPPGLILGLLAVGVGLVLVGVVALRL